MGNKQFIRKLDHLVYCVPDLEKAIQFFNQELGIQTLYGGQHLTQGTHNALINLGNKSYLEILAIDPSNTKVEAPRWMGIDLVKESKLTRWALDSVQLKKDSVDLKEHNEEMGVIIAGERKTSSGDMLKWKMIKPLAQPEVELIPFMVDWSDSDFHPTDKMPEMCTLKSLEFYQGSNQTYNNWFASKLKGFEIKTVGEAAIRATIHGPAGTITI